MTAHWAYVSAAYAATGVIMAWMIASAYLAWRRLRRDGGLQ